MAKKDTRDPNDPRRKKSREADKLRKRERRRQEKYKKMMRSATSKFERATYASRIAESREVIKKLSYNRETQSYGTDDFTEIRNRGTRAQKGVSLREELRRASTKRPSALGANKRVERIRSKAFWVATQALWENEPEKDKLDAIYDKVKGDFNSIEDYYQYIMDQPEVKEAIARALGIDRDDAGLVDDTDDQSDAYYEAERGEVDTDAGGTPIVLHALAYINAVMAYA